LFAKYYTEDETPPLG